MSDIRKVTETFSVAPQLQITDLIGAKLAGFKTIICNQPDKEGGPDQPSIAEMQKETEALGLSFLALPFAGMPSAEIAAQQGALIEAADAPVLAYCRSGTRSITAWALSQTGQGQGERIIAASAEAGYDLSGLSAYL